MEYKKYAIFFGIVLIVAGTIACGGKDTVSEKDRIKDIEVYDDNNELVMLQETEIVNRASTTALYSVMFKIIKKEEGYIIKSFLKAFRQNFKQSTIIWLLLIGTGCIVGYDWYIAVTYIKLNRQIINILE